MTIDEIIAAVKAKAALRTVPVGIPVEIPCAPPWDERLVAEVERLRAIERAVREMLSGYREELAVDRLCELLGIKIEDDQGGRGREGGSEVSTQPQPRIDGEGIPRCTALCTELLLGTACSECACKIDNSCVHPGYPCLPAIRQRLKAADEMEEVLAELLGLACLMHKVHEADCPICEAVDDGTKALIAYKTAKGKA